MSGQTDFFISYTGADKAWAEWIAWTLEAAGHTTCIQAWDFIAGSNFVLQMQEATANSTRTIAVISPDYFKSSFTQPEWAAAFVADATSAFRKLIPVRIADFQPEGLLPGIIYIDLVKKTEAQAKEFLSQQITAITQGKRLKPTSPPPFPAGAPSSASVKAPPFPGTPIPAKLARQNLPFSPNPDFQDPRDLLGTLHAALQRQLATAITQPATVHGLGGVGKTQLAIAYAWAHQADYDFILWAGASALIELHWNIAALAKVLSLPEAAATEQATQFNAVRDWLSANERWLLILDNADTPEALAAVQAFLPPGLHGHVIVTSRRTDWANDFNRIPLDVFPEAEAAKFLLKRAGKGGFQPGPEADALAIARELGGLPLALEQAGAYIARYHINFAGYVAELKKSRKKLLDFAAPGSTGHKETVARTWLVNEPHLSPAARAVLQIAAFLAPDDIPRALFEQGKEIIAEAAQVGRGVLTAPPGSATAPERRAEDSPPYQPSDADIREALAELAALSLVELEPDGFSCHRLLQAVLLDRLGPADRKAWGQLAVRLVNGYTPAEPYDVRTWPVWDPLRPHAAALLQAIGEDADIDASVLMGRLGLLLNAKAIHAEAEPLMRRALAIAQRESGPDDPAVSACLINLATVLNDVNRLAEAEPLVRKALAIDECSFGPNHSTVARDLNNLAQLLKATNRMAEAETPMQRVACIFEKTLGQDHPLVAISLNNLARLLQETNRLADAEPLMRRAVKILETPGGEPHPIYARAVNNLAQLLQATNRLAEAEPLICRALAIDERSYGPEHPYVAISLNNLAQLLQATNRLAEAEPLMRRALAIDERSYGPEHPVVATDLNTLATLFHDTNRLAEAEPLYRRALAIDERSNGLEHPETAADLNNLAALLQATNRLAEAEPLKRRALAIDERSYGPEHPNVARDLNNLAQLLQVTGRLEEAEPLMKRAAGIFLRSLGAEHPNTKTVVDNYQRLLSAMKVPGSEIRARMSALTSP